jgi:mannosyltransferase
LKVFPFLTLLAVSAYVRLLHLPEKSFDRDEMATAAWVLSRDFGELYQHLQSPFEGNTFGYPVFIYFWGKAGHSELWLRMPSVLASLFTIGIFYWHQARRLHWAVALLSSAFLSLSPLFLFHSRNARPYSFLILFAFLAFLFFRQAEKRPGNPRALALFAAFSTLALYTHHFAFFYLAPLWGLLLWRILRKQIPAFSFWAVVAPALLWLPALPLFLHQMQHGPRWIPAITPALLWSETLSPFSMQHEAASVVFASLCALGLWRGAAGRDVIGLWALAPLLLAALFSLLFRPVFLGQYFAPSVLGLAALGALGLDAYPRRSGTFRSLVVALAFTGLALAAWRLPVFYANTQGSDFKGAADFIVQNQESCGSAVVVDPRVISRWPFYLPPSLKLVSWEARLPREPFWFVQAGYPTPPFLTVLAELHSLWRGQDAMVACIRAQ